MEEGIQEGRKREEKSWAVRVLRQETDEGHMRGLQAVSDQEEGTLWDFMGLRQGSLPYVRNIHSGTWLQLPCIIGHADWSKNLSRFWDPEILFCIREKRVFPWRLEILSDGITWYRDLGECVAQHGDSLSPRVEKVVLGLTMVSG